MSSLPLMPKATAVWLVDNTSLTFEQIAAFCGLHVLEVKGIADGDVAQGIKGMDPISAGELTRDEIRKAQESTAYRMKISGPKVEIPKIKRKKAPRYTPVSRRQDRPNAILWLLKHHPELLDSQVIRLVGTTKPTIAAIRDRTHWNSANLVAQDPVALGLCTQIDLDAEVQKGAKRLEKERLAKGEPATPPETLLPTEETTPDVSPEERLAAHPSCRVRSHPRVRRRSRSRSPTLTRSLPSSRALCPTRQIKTADSETETESEEPSEVAGLGPQPPTP